MQAVDEVDDKTCPRCHCCGTYWEDCYNCGGEGYHELYDDDPLWYDEDDIERCDICEGKGGWWMCIGNCDENGRHKPKDIISKIVCSPAMAEGER